MKQIYFLIIAIIFSNITYGQIVNIPDANFKDMLINQNVADIFGNGIYYDVDTNNDGEIQVTEAEAVQVLSISNYSAASSERINSLEGIEAFVNLNKLSCNYNNLTSLDLSSNTLLIELNCRNNLLTTLNIKNGNNAILNSLDASNNSNLGCVKVDSREYALEQASTNWWKISLGFYSEYCDSDDILIIPDPNFKDALVNQTVADFDGDGTYDGDVDLNNDSEIQLSEALSVIGLNVNKPIEGVVPDRIESIVGIEAFFNLESLKFDANKVSSLDLTLNLALTELSFRSNQITYIPLNNNINLTKLYCGNFESTNPDLTRNTFHSLDLTELVNMVDFDSSNGEIYNLDFSLAPNLTFVNCKNGLLYNLNVKNGNNALLGVLDATNNPNLTCIKVDDNDYANSQLTWVKDTEAKFSYFCDDDDIINIPDPNFKHALLETKCVINYGYIPTHNADLNNNGELEFSEAKEVDQLVFNQNGGYAPFTFNINSLVGIESFVNAYSFKMHLNKITNVGHNPSISTLHITGSESLTIGPIGVMDTSGFPELRELIVYSNGLTSLNVTQNSELRTLNCADNLLTSIDVSQNSLLGHFRCGTNNLTSLNISQNPDLGTLSCGSNSLTSLDVLDKPKLHTLYCSGNQLTSLDVSNNPLLDSFNCSDNQLTEIFEKNGRIVSNIYDFDFSNNPDLAFICVDDEELDYVYTLVSDNGLNNCVVNPYCSFVPGGEVFEIFGQNIFDYNLNGCDISDPVFPNLKFNISDGINTGSLICSVSGNYLIPATEGTHTITPQLEYPNYFNIFPSSVTVEFPTENSPYAQDFCITPNGVHNDLEVVLIPLGTPRPGFDTEYSIFFKNKGNATLSGDIILTFNDDLMNIISSNPVVDSQTDGQLIWNYSNLLPFEIGNIDFIMNINTPIDETFPVNDGDILDFIVDISPITNEETPNDNTFELSQTVVNSYDPNDKICLEGAFIAPDKVGEYVHYMIRFENTGTSSAVNIVVKDEIDLAKYDINSLIPISGSHSFITRIRDSNIVEFIFENINLPFDDANNDGNVVFKIRTQPTLVLDDVIENNAEIFFDYNAPIITNNALTTVSNTLSTEDYVIDSSIEMYPNPVKDILNITSQNPIKSISIHDINGRALSDLKLLGNKTKTEVNLNKLSKGIYFVKVTSELGDIVERVVKK